MHTLQMFLAIPVSLIVGAAAGILFAKPAKDELAHLEHLAEVAMLKAEGNLQAAKNHLLELLGKL